MWYSNVGKKDYQREPFAELELYNLTDSTIAYILGVRECQIWKLRAAQAPIPPKYKKKLERLLEHLGR